MGLGAAPPLRQGQSGQWVLREVDRIGFNRSDEVTGND